MARSTHSAARRPARCKCDRTFGTQNKKKRRPEGRRRTANKARSASRSSSWYTGSLMAASLVARMEQTMQNGCAHVDTCHRKSPHYEVHTHSSLPQIPPSLHVHVAFIASSFERTHDRHDLKESTKKMDNRICRFFLRFLLLVCFFLPHVVRSCHVRGIFAADPALPSPNCLGRWSRSLMRFLLCLHTTLKSRMPIHSSKCSAPCLFFFTSLVSHERLS